MRTEKDLDRALEAALENDLAFGAWFLRQTRFQAVNARRVWSRSDNPWCRVTLPLANNQTGDIELVAREGETDVLVVFETQDGRRLGVHVENKLATGSFTPFQPEVYAARAQTWKRNPNYGNYDEWETVLLAPLAFYRRYTSEARKFGAFIAHESVAAYLPDFRND